MYKQFTDYMESRCREEMRLRRRRYEDRCDVARTFIHEMELDEDMNNVDDDDDDDDEKQERRFDSYSMYYDRMSKKNQGKRNGISSSSSSSSRNIKKREPDMSIFHSPWNRYRNRNSMSNEVLTTGSKRTIGCKNKDVSYYKELIRMLE
jgi:hypothetical protein